MIRVLGSRSLRIWAFALSFAVVAFAAAGARAATPIPAAPDRWVTDTAGMISEATRAGLDGRLENYERSTGHQIVVWIGKTIDGEDLADFSNKAFQAWRIGRHGHDDGVLMVVLAQDRKIDIEVGYGLEANLTDARSHRIIDEVMVPRLRAGDPNGALTAGVEGILGAVEGHAVPNEPESPVATAPQAHLSPLAMVGLGILGVLLLVFFATHPALAMYFLFSVFNGGGGFGSGGGGGGGGFGGGGGRSGGGGARGGW